MVGGKAEPRRRRAAKPSGSRTIGGHEVVVPDDHERWREVYIDGRRVSYGIAADGTYWLGPYAYDPAPSLDEVIERYLAYLDGTSAKRAGS